MNRSQFAPLMLNSVLIAASLFVTTATTIPLDYESRAENAGSKVVSTAVAASPEGIHIYEDGDTTLCDIDVFRFSDFGGSDCWGWEGPDGTEYAIMGVHDGVAFVNVTSGEYIQTVPGPTSGCGGIRWRDMVTYQNYCYCVSECSGTNDGMMIIDMQFLPDSVHFISAFDVGGNTTSHNMSIDTARGYAYVLNSSGSEVRIISLANPTSPAEVGSIPIGQLHDVFVRNDTAWAAEANQHSFSIWNVANKSSPQLITRVNMPGSGYVHNIWPTADGTHVVTTEETNFKTIKIWNVADPENVQLVSEYLGPSNLAHNAQIQDSILYVSHYESGVVALDISDPSSPVEMSIFDTWPASEEPQFNGCWGVFPHTASGKVYASNDDGHLYILELHEVEVNDEFVGDSVVIASGGKKVRVDVSIDNYYSVRSFIIPFNWSGDYGMTFDSVSTQGLRTEYFETQQYLNYDPWHFRAAYWLVSSQIGASPDLEPGIGPVLSIFLTVPSGVTGGPNPITFDQVGAFLPEVSTECFSYSPPATSGYVALYVAQVCCVGTVGNIDGDEEEIVDVTDLTELIDHLFVSLEPLDCSDEANIDGSGDGVVDVVDLTKLIEHLFITLNDNYAVCP